MDESVKQIVGIVIAVVVGLLLIAFVSSDGFKGKIENKIETEIDKVTFVQNDDFNQNI